MKILILFCLGVLTVAAFSTVNAQALDAGSATSQVTTTTTTTPPPELHNPVTHPAAALSDLQQAKKSGWALALFALLVMLTRAGVHLSAQFKSLGFLAKGRAHFVIAAVGALAVAGYNALALGGSIYAAIIAAGGALLYVVMPTPKAESTTVAP